MESKLVCEKLLAIHREIQGDCGEDPTLVTPHCRPLSDLPGFDSMLIPGAIRALSRELGAPMGKDDKITNLYLSEDGKQKLTITEIANAFCLAFGKEVK